jgi:plastocyanin
MTPRLVAPSMRGLDLPRRGRPLRALCLALAAVIALGCGSGATGTDDPTSIEPNALTIQASNLAFSTNQLSAPAGKPFQIVFENKEAAPHNVAIYTDSSASKPVFKENPFSGPRREVYEVPALDPGQYYFRCDVHPNMSGTLTSS